MSLSPIFIRRKTGTTVEEGRLCAVFMSDTLIDAVEEYKDVMGSLLSRLGYWNDVTPWTKSRNAAQNIITESTTRSTRKKASFVEIV